VPPSLARLQWAPLPAAEAEVAAIAARFRADRRLVVTGAGATKAAFAAAGHDGTLASTRYVHVAAHGHLSPGAPQWSSLVLAGDRAAPGYVTAAEIATYAIGADLVVLSACETALGKDVAGEGVFGLPYALTVAGARATLLSLWPVSDDSAAAFMARFYARLARGATPTVALAETKREFIRDPKFAAPFHWAPWVLYGG
jgi:CHAT domain-containing protein